MRNPHFLKPEFTKVKSTYKRSPYTQIQSPLFFGQKSSVSQHRQLAQNVLYICEGDVEGGGLFNYTFRRFRYLLYCSDCLASFYAPISSSVS